MANTKQINGIEEETSFTDLSGVQILPVDVQSLTMNGTAKKETVCGMRFNQDGTSLIVTTNIGFRVFDLPGNGDVILLYDIQNISQVMHIMRLFSSNLVAYVTESDPESLRIMNMRRGTLVADHRYDKPVQWLSLNRVRVVVAANEKDYSKKECGLTLVWFREPVQIHCTLDGKVYIHKIRNMEVLHIIKDGTVNPHNLFAMAAHDLRSFLAYPCAGNEGRIRCYELESCAERYCINAHRAAIDALSFNAEATRLATASIKGTVVRVFDASNGTKLHELRRGLRSALVYCLAFSSNGEYLGCSTESETIHIFKIPTDAQRVKLEEEQGWLASVGHIATQATGMISTEVERYMLEERAFFTLQNPYHGVKTVLNVFMEEGSVRLQVCGMNGFMNGFSIVKKEKEWVSDLQKAYFLTELVPKDTKQIAQKRWRGRHSRGQNGVTPENSPVAAHLLV